MGNPDVNWCLREWLHFLENRHAQAIQLRLENVQMVARRLDLLNIEVPVITVAGTNGKGSTMAALKAIYCAAGYRVGSYTSPHLVSFNERICVNEQQIDDRTLCRAFHLIEKVRAQISLTYFEVVTLASLIHFKQSAVDVILLEVGVGGRLDATNIIDADLAIITTVALDHQHLLGQDTEAIGYEKAGIMRENKPCIYADEAIPNSVVSHAKKLQVELYCLGEHYTYRVCAATLNLMRKDAVPIAVPVPKLNYKAAMAAIIATDFLSARLPVTLNQWKLAMQRVSIQGRQQLVPGDVSILYDVAHNPQAVQLLADFMVQYGFAGTIHAVFSGLKDKDLRGMIRPLSTIIHHWYPACLSGGRAADENDLQAAFQAELARAPICFSSPETAFSRAKQSARPGDLIVVYGSFLLVGAILEVSHETSHI